MSDDHQLKLYIICSRYYLYHCIFKFEYISLYFLVTTKTLNHIGVY
jgi:hypothetical protein